MVALARPRRLTDTHDFSFPQPFAKDVVQGLTKPRKQLAAKYFYDREGSRLFEGITEAPEYYPTRCELEILRTRGSAIDAFIPKGAALVEFGSGSSRKLRELFAAVPDLPGKLSCYVPVDISGEFLRAEADALCADFPQLNIRPVVADFCFPFDLPPEAKSAPTRVGFFPGSTIGNFEPHEAATFLKHAGRTLLSGARFILGVDLVKDSDVLNAAYNDAAGITAAFNLNLLTRMNRELDGNFDRAAFEHHAFFNRERSRIEMHLASHKRQKVRVAGETFDFRAGETIHTESSYKYSIEKMGALARGAGWVPSAVWTDARGYFSVQAFTLADEIPTQRSPV